MSSKSATAVLLISCRDQKGLVAAVADFLYRRNANIVHADQHTDPEERVFLQRVEFELDGFELAREDIAPAFQPIADRFGMAWALRFSDDTPRVAILVSKMHHCLYDLLARWRLGELHAEVPLVISNHPDAGGIAADYGIAFHHLPVTPATREGQESAIASLLDDERIDLVVLARYMQVLGDGFVSRYPQRIINIHHSFLPSFKGAKPYHQAHERGVKIIGATAHYVTPALDEGPIIEQETARVTHAMSPDDLIAAGRDIESRVLARAVKLHLESRVMLNGKRTVVFG
jgi:formyltetrahydrofolate deformylase